MNFLNKNLEVLIDFIDRCHERNHTLISLIVGITFTLTIIVLAITILRIISFVKSF